MSHWLSSPVWSQSFHCFFTMLVTEPISVASLLFYINPTTQLVVGLVYFDLVAAPEEWLVFGLIWTGLALYFASRRRCGASVNHAR